MASASSISPTRYATERVFRSRLYRPERVVRTEEKILHAFRAALHTGGGAAISVARIADSCGIARSTLYRHFATITEMVWAVALPHFQEALDCALVADLPGFDRAVAALWSIPGLVPALTDARCSKVRGKLATIAAAAVERVWRNRNADACGVLVSGAWFALLDREAETVAPQRAGSADLMMLIYTVAFLTPPALKALSSAKPPLAGSFPPAVSARESLSNDRYIISMIDGKPYRLLTRHIARYGLTPDSYRRCFRLPADYPMAARDYAHRRRAAAAADNA